MTWCTTVRHRACSGAVARLAEQSLAPASGQGAP